MIVTVLMSRRNRYVGFILSMPLTIELQYPRQESASPLIKLIYHHK